jgi:hypothetical protein
MFADQPVRLMNWNRKMTSDTKTFKFDVALSFAGENRDVVEKIAKALQALGFTVFYDKWEEAELWGKDLIQHLDDVYRNQALFCIIFVSRHYVQKAWTRHELRSAQARAFKEHSDYILPLKLDDTELPGLLETVGYLDLRATTIENVVSLFARKLTKQKEVEQLMTASARAAGQSKERTLSSDGTVDVVQTEHIEAVASQLSSVGLEGGKIVRLYWAADSPPLTHKFGRELADPAAITGRALYSEGWNGSLEDGRLFWGPYEALPSPGWYTAAFRIRVNENASRRPIIRIDINTNSMRGLIFSKDLSGVTFNAPNTYQVFLLNFEYKGANDVEYRVSKFDASL